MEFIQLNAENALKELERIAVEEKFFAVIILPETGRRLMVRSLRPELANLFSDESFRETMEKEVEEKANLDA